METISNRRIAKNTVLLYFRMLLMMGVGLYTSRVALQILGATDYGLYNVVGGMVALFAFLNSALSAGTSRFITYELGVGDKARLREMFNITLVSHILLAVVVFIAAETVGLWFVNTHLVFPPERLVAVNVVYQFSIATLMLQLTQVPYTADIIAHEKMNIYAYASLLDAVLKLGAVYLLMLDHRLDNLILYSALLFIVQLITISVYRIYCYRKYEESHWAFCKELHKYKTVFSFSCWDVIGGATVILRNQGTGVLLNIFFGPIVNAAHAIASQVEAGFTQLVNNFMTAVNPQIVKSYAVKNHTDMIALVHDSSKYAFYLLAVFLIPILFKLDYVLHLWLAEVPPQAGIFAGITLLYILTRSIVQPVIRAVHATGNIKYLNLYAGGIGLLPVPIIYVAFRHGCPAEDAYWIFLATGFFNSLAEILVLKKELPEFGVRKYVVSVFGRCAIVSTVVAAINYFMAQTFSDTFGPFVLYYAASVVLNSIIVLYCGFDKSKRKIIVSLVLRKLKIEKDTVC